MTAGARGRLDDVTKLLQTQRRDKTVAYAKFLSTGEFSLPFPRSPRSQVSAEGNFLNQPRHNQQSTAASPPSDSTRKSNNFGVSHKRFKPRPGSTEFLEVVHTSDSTIYNVSLRAICIVTNECCNLMSLYSSLEYRRV